MKKTASRPGRKAKKQMEKDVLEMSVEEIEGYVGELKKKRPMPLSAEDREDMKAMRKGMHRSILLPDSAIKRGVGRPRVGEGAKVVLISLERGLLKEADAFAKGRKMSRSQMIADALRETMRRAG